MVSEIGYGPGDCRRSRGRWGDSSSRTTSVVYQSQTLIQTSVSTYFLLTGTPVSELNRSLPFSITTTFRYRTCCPSPGPLVRRRSPQQVSPSFEYRCFYLTVGRTVSVYPPSFFVCLSSTFTVRRFVIRPGMFP